MSSKYCKYLINCINFKNNGITFCNQIWHPLNPNPYIEYGNNEIENFLQKKKEILENLQNGSAPYGCEHCLYLEDSDKNITSDKLKYIEFNHWQECNCACFYCSLRDMTKLRITTKRNVKGNTDVLRILKKLEKMNQLDKELNVSLVGGEPTLLKDFANILKYIIKHKYSVDILTNGILYEKYIPKALLASENTFLTISIDSGCRETYKKIKSVDKFDEVVKNLTKYIKEAKPAKERIRAKYIILEGVNDNKEEIDKWLDICLKMGIISFFPAIEFCHAALNPQEHSISENIAELYNYIKEKVQAMGGEYHVCTYDFVEEFIKNRSYSINK